MTLSRRSFAAANLTLAFAAGWGADEREATADDNDAAIPPSPFNLPTKTLGGKQFWTDLAIDHGWRVQQNAMTKHCRLLDPGDVRRAWGSHRQVYRDFEKIRKSEKLAPYDGRVLLTLHGLMRSRSSMQGLCDHVEKEGYKTLNMSYASSRAAVQSHALALHSVLENIRGDVQIYLAGHSLGNLVIRRYWRDCQEAGRRPDPRIRRVVMLAPPNQGARLAEVFRDNQLFHTVWGLSGRQIAEWATLEKQLGTPTCQFGIIAGGASGRNPLLKGDDDWVVTVKETQLVGAHDFLVLPTNHTWIMNDKKSRECLLRFLQNGFFVSAAKRFPLTKDNVAKTP